MTDGIIHKSDDELLSAYIDNELPDEEAGALDERLGAEPELMRRLEALRAADAAVREAYAQIDRTPLPASVLDLFDDARPASKADNVIAFPTGGIRRFFEAPVAVAASIALAVGFVGALLLRPDVLLPAPGAVLVAGAVPSDSAFYELLESTPSGELRDLSGDPAEVLLTFEDVTGDWCRQIRVGGAGHSIHGVACRRGGTWQLETIALGAAGTPDGQFGTAAGTAPGAIEAAVDGLIGAGAPLGAAEEKAFISGAWEKPAE